MTRNAIVRILQIVTKQVGYIPKFQNLLTLVLGFITGIILAFTSFYDLKYSSRPLSYSSGYSSSVIKNLTFIFPTIRCIIILRASLEKSERQLLAIMDTYGPRCNETLYYTTEPKLRLKYSKELSIFSIDLHTLRPDSWSFLKFILADSSRNRTLVDWTILADEMTFVIPENLRYFVRKNLLDPEFAWISGRTNEHDIISRVFLGFGSYFDPKAGLLMSRGALRLLLTEKNPCFGWFFPHTIQNAFIKCFTELGAEVAEDFDSKKRRYFLDEGPHSIIPKFLGITNKGIYRKHESGWFSRFSTTQTRLSLDPCCSDKVITFGRSNYRELRLIGYVVYNLQIFNIEKI